MCIRYVKYLLLALQEAEAAEISRKVLQAVKILGWQMGKSRVFLRAGQLAQLEVRICSHFKSLAFLQQQGAKLAV